MAQLSPYINFEGNAKDAMNFYKSCFGGELSIQTIGESPMAAECPTGIHGQVMHSMLTTASFVMMGSDMTRPDGTRAGNNITLSLNCESEEEMRSLFDKLAEGGKIAQPIKIEFWGGLFGYLADKFGIQWMFSAQPA